MPDLTTREAAETLALSTQTIRRYAHSGLLPAKKLYPSRQLRFDAQAVRSLIERDQRR
jgi:excisionase family DNA binding protein